MNVLKETQGYFSGAGRLRLFFRSYAIDNPSAVFIVVHGLGEHSQRYLNFVNFFTQRNFNLYLFDLRGHGLSQGRRGHTANFNEYLLDLKEFCGLVKDKEGNKNIFLIGHSLGGLIVLRYIQEFGQNLKAAIVSSPALKSLIAVPSFKIYLTSLLSNILPQAAFFNQINPDHISREGKVIEDYKNDKLVHNRITARCFTEITKAMLEAYRKADTIKIPCLILQAGDDRIVSALTVSAFFKHLSAPKKQLKVYPGFYHELFNEREKEKVFMDIYNWVFNLSEKGREDEK